MSGRRELPDQLSEDELTAQWATELPARQAMSAIGDIAIPLDPDMAADVLLAQDVLDDPAGASPD